MFGGPRGTGGVIGERGWQDRGIGTHRRGGCRLELVGGSIVKLEIIRGPYPCDELSPYPALV